MPAVHHDWNDLVRAAQRQGWRVQRRRRHLMLLAPDGEGMVCLATSPGDRRSIRNTLADMRRHGFTSET